VGDTAPLDMYSYDGISWSSGIVQTQGVWSSMCWSPENLLFVAVQAESSAIRLLRSTDGIYWMSLTMVSSNWTSITWSPELSLFCTVAATTTSSLTISTSPDSSIWTSRQPTTPANWNAVSWSPQLSMFVAVASDSSTIMYSTSGITWTSASAATVGGWSSLAWSPSLSRFVSLSSSTATVPKVMNTVSTFTGMPTTVAMGTRDVSLTTIDGKTVIVGQSASIVKIGQYANDVQIGREGNVTTIRGATTFNNANSYLDVYNTNIGYTALATVQTISFETTNSWILNRIQGPSAMATWSQELGIFCALVPGQSHIMTSSDGIIWISRTAASNNFWWGICWSPQLSLFVLSLIHI
jgi:hypothetical protein